MKKESKQEQLSEEQIDEIVVAQAKNDAAWKDPILVRAVSPTTLSLPSELAARVVFSPGYTKRPASKIGSGASSRNGLTLKKRLLPG